MALWQAKLRPSLAHGSIAISTCWCHAHFFIVVNDDRAHSGVYYSSTILRSGCIASDPNIIEDATLQCYSTYR